MSLESKLRETEAALEKALVESDRLVKEQRQGQAASLIVAELVALVPLEDTLAASATGKALVEYFRSVLASNAALRVALEALYEWYDRDGSVGGASTVFEQHRSALASLPKGEGR